MREVLRVIGARILRDAKLGAQEGRADLGDKLFGGIGILLEPRSEVAVTAGLVAGCVRLMPISA